MPTTSRPPSRSAPSGGIPITARGAGTNVAGNAIGPGVVLDTSRHLNRVLAVDLDASTATVQPGVVLDRLQADGSRTWLGPEPDQDLAARLRSVRDAHLVLIRRDLGRFGRQISGYGLHYLLPERGFDLAKAFTGSEGTCGSRIAARSAQRGPGRRPSAGRC